MPCHSAMCVCVCVCVCVLEPRIYVYIPCRRHAIVVSAAAMVPSEADADSDEEEEDSRGHQGGKVFDNAQGTEFSRRHSDSSVKSAARGQDVAGSQGAKSSSPSSSSSSSPTTSSTTASSSKGQTEVGAGGDGCVRRSSSGAGGEVPSCSAQVELALRTHEHRQERAARNVGADSLESSPPPDPVWYV
jgi:hypothetical protein